MPTQEEIVRQQRADTRNDVEPWKVAFSVLSCGRIRIDCLMGDRKRGEEMERAWLHIAEEDGMESQERFAAAMARRARSLVKTFEKELLGDVLPRELLPLGMPGHAVPWRAEADGDE